MSYLLTDFIAHFNKKHFFSSSQSPANDLQSYISHDGKHNNNEMCNINMLPFSALTLLVGSFDP